MRSKRVLDRAHHRESVGRLLFALDCARNEATQLREDNERLRFTLEVANALGDFQRDETGRSTALSQPDAKV